MQDGLTAETLCRVVEKLREVGWSGEWKPMRCNPEMVNEVLAIWDEWCASPPQTPDQRERAWKCGEFLMEIRHEDGSMLHLPPLLLP